MARRMERCAHCGNTGTERTVEWNPLDEHWQCRNVVKCAKTSAERKLEGGLRRAMRGRK